MKLRQAMIFVKDLTRMTAFYRDALRLHEKLETRREDWVELEAGGAAVALHAVPSDIAVTIDMKTPPEARAQTPIKLVFESDNVEADRAHLVAHGATMFEPQTWGGCDGLDPEGNVFQIVRKG